MTLGLVQSLAWCILFSYFKFSFVLELATRLLLRIGMDWTTHKSLRYIKGREVKDFHFGEIMR